MEVGQVGVKIAGRDAGQHCVIVDVLDGNFVLVDGNTRRRKCNIRHLEILDLTLDVKKNATHEEVTKAMKAAGLKVLEVKKGTKTRKAKTAKQVVHRKALTKEVKAPVTKKTKQEKK